MRFAWDYNPMYSPFNNGTQMTPMRQITADLFFWQRNKRTYFSFDSMFFYITAQSRRSCWTRFSISPRAFTYPLLSARSWNKLTFVQFAHALHTQPSLALLSLNRKFQDDFGRFLLFLHSFWKSQFNTYVLLSKKNHMCCWKSFTKHKSKIRANLGRKQVNSQLGGKKCLVGKKYVSSWKNFSLQLETLN